MLNNGPNKGPLLGQWSWCLAGKQWSFKEEGPERGVRGPPGLTGKSKLTFSVQYIDVWETKWPIANGYRAGLRTERSGFEPWPGNCVIMFLGKTLCSCSASLHPEI